MARCFLGVWENACGCLGAFCGWAWLKAFWEAAETHVAVEGPWSLELLHWVGMFKCVLGGCEKAGGWLGPLEPWVAVGLLSWCTGHGLNAFWEAVKTYVAVWGPWSLGLQVCCPGALGIGLNAFWESGKTHVAVLGPFVPWTGWAWLKCVLEAVKNAGWPFGACGARGALGLL